MTMDTLVAVGTLSAWGYSVLVALFPEVVMGAGVEPMTSRAAPWICPALLPANGN